MPWRQHTSSTQHHDNKQPTPFRFRSSFGRVSVFHRYPEYPTATPGDSRSPGVAGVDHGVFPYRNWLAPARIWFWFGWFRKNSYLCTVKKCRVSSTIGDLSKSKTLLNESITKDNKTILASEYKLYLPTEQQLINEVNEVKAQLRRKENESTEEK